MPDLAEPTSEPAGETRSSEKDCPSLFQIVGRVAVVAIFLWTLIVSIRGFRALFREVPTSEEILASSAPTLSKHVDLVSVLKQGGVWEFATSGIQLETALETPARALSLFESRHEPVASGPIPSEIVDEEWKQLSHGILQMARSLPHNESVEGGARLLKGTSDSPRWRIMLQNDLVISAAMVMPLDSEQSLFLSIAPGSSTSGSKANKDSQCELLPFPESSRCLARRVATSGDVLCELATTRESPEQFVREWERKGYEVESKPGNSGEALEIWCSRDAQSCYVWTRPDPETGQNTLMVVNLLSGANETKDRE